MKGLIALFVLVIFHTASKAQVGIIMDTDIAPDYDDVGALAMLHAFADKGSVRILATISCNAFETTVPTLSVINTYFGRSDCPVGITRRLFPNKPCEQRWAQSIIEAYPHFLRSNSEAHEAVALYREVLSHQPDHSVLIVSTGFFTNLADLLKAGPDSISSKSGMELVKQKVKGLISMAGNISGSQRDGYEFNIQVDAQSAKVVFDTWPTPITLCGFEIGERILTGIPLSRDSSNNASPVKDAYQIALKADRNTKGRCSWDQSAIWVAIQGPSPWFRSRMGNMEVFPDGKNRLKPGNRIRYLELQSPPEEMAKLFEWWMGQKPKTKN